MCGGWELSFADIAWYWLICCDTFDMIICIYIHIYIYIYIYIYNGWRGMATQWALALFEASLLCPKLGFGDWSGSRFRKWSRWSDCFPRESLAILSVCHWRSWGIRGSPGSKRIHLRHMPTSHNTYFAIACMHLYVPKLGRRQRPPFRPLREGCCVRGLKNQYLVGAKEIGSTRRK